MLNQKFIKIAELDFGENDLKKSQSLAQFREWISKHSFLSHVRQDDVYLLGFIRARKYNMQRSFDMFEWKFLSKKKFPKLLDFNDDDVARILSMLHTGFCFPLAQRDEDGSRSVICQYSKWNPDEFSAYESIRLINFVLINLLEEEETQIAGIKIIYNLEGLTTKHFVSPMEFMDMMDFFVKTLPIKFKGLLFSNPSASARIFIEIGRSFLQEKLKGRIHILGGLDELQKHMNTALLPKDYLIFNGTQTEAEMIQEFSENLVEKNLKSYYEFVRTEIDWKKATQSKLWLGESNENVGSFRNLSLD